MDNGIKVISLVGNNQSPSRIWQAGLSRFFVLSLMKIISISILKQKFCDILFCIVFDLYYLCNALQAYHSCNSRETMGFYLNKENNTVLK